MGQSSNLGPNLQDLLTWAKVTKGLPCCINLHGPRFEPRAYPAVFTGWAKVRIKSQLCSINSLWLFTRVGQGWNLKKGLPCGIYSRGPRFEPKAYRILRYLLAACSRFQPMVYRTLRYLLALLTWQLYNPDIRYRSSDPHSSKSLHSHVP
jgi:hypothetical protein